MDVGRLKLELSQTPPRNATERSLQDLYAAFNALQGDILTSPGPVESITGEAITKGDAIQLRDGKIYKASAAGSIAANGVAKQSAALGATIRCVLLSGLVEVYTGLVAGQWYYLADGGAITAIKPISGMIQGIGVALSESALFVHIYAP